MIFLNMIFLDMILLDIIFLENDLYAQLPAGLVPLVGRGGTADRLAQEEQQLPGQHRHCCLFLTSSSSSSSLSFLSLPSSNPIKGTRAKPKHREGRTSDRFHVANRVPQRCGK